MKVNRFGMSEKVFTSIVKLWAVTQHNRVQTLYDNGLFELCAETNSELKELLQKTFLKPDADVQILMRDCDKMAEQLSQEQTVQA